MFKRYFRCKLNHLLIELFTHLIEVRISVWKKDKLEQQLLAKGITKEQLEKQLDTSTVEEDLEANNFTYGKPYKRVDPAVSIILSAVAKFYNGRIINAYNNKESAFDDGYRILEVFATKGRKIEIEIYTDYLLQALDDAWTKHTSEDPFMVAMNGKAYRNNFRKARN